MTDKDKDLFSEKVITIDMVENDFIVKMPPKNRYKVRVRVKEVKRGEPRIVQPDEFQLYKKKKKRDYRQYIYALLWQNYKEMLILELEEMKKYFLDSRFRGNDHRCHP